MSAIYFSLTLMLLWIHFAAITALAGPRFGSWAIGRAIGIIIIVMAGFCFEHLVGLGSLRLVWPFSIVIALGILWVSKTDLKEQKFIQGEIVFAAALAFGLTWRVLFPSIYHTAERLPDAMFISSYITGDTLPPVDHWLPPFKFDYYYTLQYYGAALAGRIFNMTVGVTYNMGVVFLSAMALSLLWDIASRYIGSKFLRLLLVASIAFGGTGLSVLNHAIINDMPSYSDHLVASARFIGEYDSHINTEIGRALFPQDNPPGFVPRLLGMENFGYQYFLGEYHAPMGGYFLLFLSIALLLGVETASDEDKSRKRWLQAGMGLSAAAILATNTWFLPFQGVLLGSWALWRTWQGRKNPVRNPDWMALIVSGVVGFLLIYPFLIGFASRPPSPVELVHDLDHTPWREFLGQFWPLLILLLLGLWHRDTRRLSLFFALVFSGLLVFSELFFVNDPSGDQYERSNTVMKWWGWIWSGGLAALGAVLLAAQVRWIRYVTAITLGFTSVSSFDVVNHWVFDREKGTASLYGTNFFTADPVTRDMFRYLAVAPRGIMLENQYSTGYHEGGALSAFSGNPLFLGWTNHLRNWRGYMDLIGNRSRDVSSFYTGQMTEPLRWLVDNNIKYVAWNRTDTVQGNWEQHNIALSPRFAWIGFGLQDDKPVGLWVRKN